jgi:anti-sigma regulatory factor (Ser/Thr protein kinase)
VQDKTVRSRDQRAGGEDVGSAVEFDDQFFSALDHVAFLYSSDEELLSVLSSFARDGLREGEPVLVVTRDERSGTSTSVERFFDTIACTLPGVQSSPVILLRSFGRCRRPATMVAEYRRLLDEHFAAGATRVRIVGPPQGESQQVGWRCDARPDTACARFEAILNRAFAKVPLKVLCPYDLRSLTESELEQVEGTHPRVLTARGIRATASYLDPSALPRVFSPGYEPVEGTEPRLDTRMHLADGIPRRAVRRAVEPAGLRPDRVSDLVLAFSEVATNALVHGFGAVSAKVWAQPGTAVCKVSDQGTSFDDLLAGYVPPSPMELAGGGIGLWLSRQLCDEVDIVPSPSGLTVRLVMAA